MAVLQSVGAVGLSASASTAVAGTGGERERERERIFVNYRLFFTAPDALFLFAFSSFLTLSCCGRSNSGGVSDTLECFHNYAQVFVL